MLERSCPKMLLQHGLLFLALVAAPAAAQQRVVNYTQTCASGTTGYGSSLSGTLYAVPSSSGGCSIVGYAGYGYCCNGAYMGTTSPWFGGTCGASTLPAVPIISQNPALGSGLYCLDTEGGAYAPGTRVVVSPCGTALNPTPSASQLWSWTNGGYGSNLYNVYSNLCVQPESSAAGSRFALALCSATNLVGTLLSTGALWQGANRYLVSYQIQ